MNIKKNYGGNLTSGIQDWNQNYIAILPSSQVRDVMVIMDSTFCLDKMPLEGPYPILKEELL